MILKNTHCRLLYLKNGKINKNCIHIHPIVEARCDECGTVFEMNAKRFHHRVELIKKELCVKCGKPHVGRVGGLRSAYDESGNLKPNAGRWTNGYAEDMTIDEYHIFCLERKKASIEFYQSLKEDPEKYKKHFSKIFKNSKIGYISKGQKEVHSILEPYGFELEQNVEGLNVDIVHKERKIVVEFFGDLFHANPRKFSPDKHIELIGMTASEKWNRDRARNFKLRKFGYQVIVIWEDKWVNDKKAVLAQLNELASTDFKLEDWWKLSTTKARQMCNHQLDKNRQVPLNEVDKHLTDGWVFGLIPRHKKLNKLTKVTK